MATPYPVEVGEVWVPFGTAIIAGPLLEGYEDAPMELMECLESREKMVEIEDVEHVLG